VNSPPEKTVEEIAQAACLARMGKKHNGLHDDSRSSSDEPRDGAPCRRHHLKFNARRPANQDQLRDRSWSIREEIGRIKYYGEQVYRTTAQNALASRMLIDQLTPHLPKDNEEVNVHVKCLQAMLDAATVVDPVLDRDDKVWGHELDHQQSPCGDSASNLTPPEEHDQRRDPDDRDLRDVIHGRDVHGRINNRRHDCERVEQE
jgi:hypothetical protein